MLFFTWNFLLPRPRARRQPQIEFCGGDYTGVVPPVPISNTEVKYTKADDSVMNAKVGSRRTIGFLV